MHGHLVSPWGTKEEDKELDHLVDLVKTGEVPMKRIDEAVADILRIKFQLGLLEKPYPDKSLKEQFATDASRQVNLQAAREAMTLLKNNPYYFGRCSLDSVRNLNSGAQTPGSRWKRHL